MLKFHFILLKKNLNAFSYSILFKRGGFIALMLWYSREWWAVGIDCGMFWYSDKSAVGMLFLLYIFKRKKEKKESRLIKGGFKWSQVFLKKYYPTAMRERKCIRCVEWLCGDVRVEIFSKTRRA